MVAYNHVMRLPFWVTRGFGVDSRSGCRASGSPKHPKHSQVQPRLLTNPNSQQLNSQNTLNPRFLMLYLKYILIWMKKSWRQFDKIARWNVFYLLTVVELWALSVEIWKIYLFYCALFIGKQFSVKKSDTEFLLLFFISHFLFSAIFGANFLY